MKAREVLNGLLIRACVHCDEPVEAEQGLKEHNEMVDTALLALKEMVLSEKKEIIYKYHHICYGGSTCCKMLDEWSEEGVIQCKHKYYINWGVPRCAKCDGLNKAEEKAVAPWSEKDFTWNQAIESVAKLFEDSK